MKVNEIVRANNCDAYEIYAYTGAVHKLHGDYIVNLDEVENYDAIKNKKVLDYEIMNEDRYNETILANSGESADFEIFYGNKDAKVLVMVISENWRTEDLSGNKKVSESKRKMAELLVSLPGFDGNKNVDELCSQYTEQELDNALEAYQVEYSDAEYDNTDLELTKEQHGKIENAHDRFDKANTKRVSLKFNKNTDRDIILWLERQSSIQGAIKDAIRACCGPYCYIYTKDEVSYTRYSFLEAVEFFRPSDDLADDVELMERYKSIKNLDDLREFLRYSAGGNAVEWIIEEITN